MPNIQDIVSTVANKAVFSKLDLLRAFDERLIAEVDIRETKNNFQLLAAPDKHFQHVHFDVVSPVPPSRSYHYCLTLFNRLKTRLKIRFQEPSMLIGSFISEHPSYSHPNKVRHLSRKSSLIDLRKMFGCKHTRMTPFHLSPPLCVTKTAAVA